MSEIEVVVTGDPRRVRDAVWSALVVHDFTVDWHDDWTATAKTGKKWAGAFAPYIKVTAQFISSETGQTTVRIQWISVAGDIGDVLARKKIMSLKNRMVGDLKNEGAVVSVRTF